jgi:thioredoxin:protein disulfide reductase
LIARTARRTIAALILCFLAAFHAAAAFAQVMPFPADQAFMLRVSRAADSVRLEWTIAAGYYLYRDKIRVTSSGADAAPTVLAGQAVSKDDPTFGSTEIYLYHAEATVSGPAAQPAPGGTLVVTYQGCQDGGICYPPITRHVDLISLQITDSAAPRTVGSSREWQAPIAKAALPGGGIALATESDGGMVAALIKNGGLALMLGSFLLFGMALAFTPCVFPMYPILAGALARSGNDLSSMRGFTLSGVYVVAMASAFGLLGVAAAWSGQNLQMVLQSPVSVGAVSLLFVALALSMFGLYELQLPSRWVNALGRTGQGRRSSLLSTAVLGFTSALIVGPCVTAPLAGALLYIAQTGDVVIGAAALFTLGVGKGIPLIAFGTVGSKALPRAGVWMESVKKGFGFIFLANAVWMVSRIIPGEYALALWALLLIGSGVYLGAFDGLPHDAPGRRRAGKTAGLAASVYGVILAVGAASGSGDPLRPLAGFMQQAAPAAETGKGAFASTADAAQLSERIASASGRPSLVYVTADWCVSCAVIERTVLPDAAVRSRLAGFNLVKIDVSDNTPVQQQMMQSLRVVGPPTMIFVDAKAQEVPGSRLIGDVTVESLLASAGKVEGSR